MLYGISSAISTRCDIGVTYFDCFRLIYIMLYSWVSHLWKQQLEGPTAHLLQNHLLLCQWIWTGWWPAGWHGRSFGMLDCERSDMLPPWRWGRRIQVERIRRLLNSPYIQNVRCWSYPSLFQVLGGEQCRAPERTLAGSGLVSQWHCVACSLQTRHGHSALDASI